MLSKRFLQIIAGAGVVAVAATAMFVYGTSYFPFEQQSPTEVSSPLPDSMSNVLAPTETLTPDEVREGQAWEPTDFSGQDQALGWKSDVFDVPEGMKTRVEFWKQIYSKYSTDQGVLHDPVTLEIYDHVDFEPYREGESITVNARARQKLVDQRRDEISDRLLALQDRLDKQRTSTPFSNEPEKASSAFQLSGEDLRYWKLYENESDPAKFKKAAARIRFQLGQRDKFLLGIYYSGRYLKEMEKIFRDEGLPIELTRLPFVESSFNTKARSKVGASGIWQFMRKTAKPYLKINAAIDERNDPFSATHAAARLMKNNFTMLRSWPLAVTAWNHGPSGVRNITQKLSTEDISQIVNTFSSRTFGFASQNFYACFLAVLAVESNASKYFAKPVWQPSFESVEVKTPRFIAWPTIVKVFDDDEALADEYNPQVTQNGHSSKPRIPAGTRLRVPASAAETAPLIFAGKKVPTSKVSEDN